MPKQNGDASIRFAASTARNSAAGVGDWREHARCRGYAPEVFFTDGLNGARQRATEEFAKRVCHDCAVLVACADYALSAPEPYGVWGAMTPRERARQRRKRG